MHASPDDEYTILIIDDNPQLLRAYAEGLPLVGRFVVTTAVNGIEGLKRYEEVHPHCVVVDVKMPGLDGYQFVQALRGDLQTATTPLIILTALTQDDERFHGLATGADRYLVKPVRPSELAAAIYQVCALDEDDRVAQLRKLVEGTERS